MNKAYVITPLVALLAFIPFYLNFSKQYEAKEQEKVQAAKNLAQEKIKQEMEARKVAVEEALALQEQRKKEKAEKEAKDLAEKEARQAAVDARDSAYREQERLSKTVDRLNKEIGVVKEEIAAIDEKKAYYQKEIAFLKQYVPQAESNKSSLQKVLTDIDAADKARIEAEKAAAAAAKAAAR